MCKRSMESQPPPGITIAPIFLVPSTVAQKPIKGPNENARNTRSAEVTPAAFKTCPQQSPHHSQLSGVSTTRSGVPVVPEV